MNRNRPLLTFSLSRELLQRIALDVASSNKPVVSYIVESRLRTAYDLPQVPCAVPCRGGKRKAMNKLVLGISVSLEVHERIQQEENAHPDKPRSRIIENRLRMGYGMPPMARKPRRNA